MTAPEGNLRWAFRIPTPIGDASSCYELSDDALRFESDAIMGGGRAAIRWEAVREGGTAALDGLGGRGGPDLPRWVPGRMEWLLLSRADGATAFMGVLPQGPERDALVASVRARLGPRWIGEGVPLREAQQRLGIETRSENLQAAAIVIAVLALLLLLLLLLSVLTLPIFSLPAGFVLGGWLFRNGLAGLRDGLAIANTPPAKVASAALGFVELEGRAITAAPSPAAITGRPSVWWDAAVEVWSEDKDSGRWQPLAARHGGAIDSVEIGDESGRVPIWLKGADLLLAEDCWEAGKDALPAPGIALLDTIGFGWSSGKRLRVRESRLEADEPMYVLGTLDERGNLPDDGRATGLARGIELVRTGEWRSALLQRLPQLLRIVVGVLFGLLDMLTKIGRGGERTRHAAAAPPDLPPTAVVVWQGRQGRPFLVSNRREDAVLASLRRRSLTRLVIGGAILCYCLYETISLL